MTNNTPQYVLHAHIFYIRFHVRARTLHGLKIQWLQWFLHSCLQIYPFQQAFCLLIVSFNFKFIQRYFNWWFLSKKLPKLINWKNDKHCLRIVLKSLLIATNFAHYKYDKVRVQITGYKLWQALLGISQRNFATISQTVNVDTGKQYWGKMCCLSQMYYKQWQLSLFLPSAPSSESSFCIFLSFVEWQPFWYPSTFLFSVSYPDSSRTLSFVLVTKESDIYFRESWYVKHW